VEDLPGPGAYSNISTFDEIKNKKVSRSKNFISNVDRFRALRKNLSPGPGHYMPEIKIEKKTNLSCFFKSEVDKGLSDKERAPGPGQYNTIIENIKRKNNTVGFDSSQDKNINMTKQGSILTSSTRIEVGPGNYNINSSPMID